MSAVHMTHSVKVMKSVVELMAAHTRSVEPQPLLWLSNKFLLR